MKKIKQFFTEKVQIETYFSLLRILLAISISLVIAFLLMCTISDTPGSDFLVFIKGPFSNTSRLLSLINKFIPLLFTGTAVCFLFSVGQISTSCEGAFYFGGVAGTIVAIIPGIPSAIHIPLCFLAAGLAGGIVALIPTIMNVRYNILTIVASLLVNNVFLYLGQYLISVPYRDPLAGYEASYKFSESALLPTLGLRHVHLGLLIGLAVYIIGYLILYKTPFGLSIRTVGQNQNFSKFSGINVGLISCAAAMLAGAFAGMGGISEALGNYERFVFAGITTHGWYGIVIAVLCKNNPKYVPIGALFIAYLSVASDCLNFGTSIPPEIVNIIQPVIIMFVAAPLILSRLEHKAIVNRSKKRLEKEGTENA